MLQPGELKKSLLIELHDGVVSPTTEVWRMLTASAEGRLDDVKQLVQQTPALSTCQYDYTSPLHLAVREGHIDLVRYLIEQGAADPGYRTHPFLDSLITVAQDRGYVEIAELLKRALADPALAHTRADTGKIDFRRDETQQRFEEALSAGKYAEVEAMLQDRPELATDEDAFWGEGVLAVPANNGDGEMIELLMRYGASVPPVSKWGARYYFKHYEIAKLLLDKGMNPNHKNWREFTLLHDMAHTGNVHKAWLLLVHGADINAIDDEYSSTALGYAARWGQREVVQLLIKNGADVNNAGASWATPLAWARKKGHADVESDLLRAGAV